MTRHKFTNRFKLAVGASLFLMMFVLAGNSLAANASRSNSINTAPSLNAFYSGGVVTVNGSGFTKGDLVNVTLAIDEASLASGRVLLDWPVVPSKDGSFEVVLPIGTFNSPTGRYVVRASSTSKEEASVEVLAPEAESANIDQCANGPFSAPVQCTGSNWINGNVNASKGHYYEGEAIPYRLKFGGLTVGSTNTVTIEWDTTKGGKHAIDYPVTYTFTENLGNDPCSGISGCSGPPSTFPIPADTNVTSLGVTQAAGNFSLFGGTITAVSGYTLSGSYAGDSSTRITITFTAGTTNPVLAWAGHIADRNDWSALGGSASDINGSPYHTRLIDLNGSGGNQDMQLSNVVVRLSTKIIIIKDARPNIATAFNFSATNPATNFSLTDTGTNTNAPVCNTVSSDGCSQPQTFTYNLAPGGTATSTFSEGLINFYELTGITCAVTGGNASTYVTSLPGLNVNVNAAYGETVTCVFINSVTTAANASVSGRVVDSNGLPISRAYVSIVNTSTGRTQTVLTNQFGRYMINDLPVGDFYVMSVSAKRYRFANGTTSFTLDDVVSDLDFTASAP